MTKTEEYQAEQQKRERKELKRAKAQRRAAALKQAPISWHVTVGAITLTGQEKFVTEAVAMARHAEANLRDPEIGQGVQVKSDESEGKSMDIGIDQDHTHD